MAAAAPFLVAAALLLPGCSGEAPRGDALSTSGRASPPPKQATTPHHEPLKTMAQGSGGLGVGAPPNDGPVPDVVGTKAAAACRALLRDGYAGGIFGEVERTDVRPGSVVEQDPKPGHEGFEGQLVHLVVSAPFLDALPRSYPCVERRDRP